jgi:hypothetical protein
VSKRSYRRVAVVAGAALALGSMAPALAQRVDVSGDVDVDVSAPATSGAGMADASSILVPVYPILGLGLGTLSTTVLGTAGIAGGTVVTTAGIVGGTVVTTAAVAGGVVKHTVDKVTGIGLLDGDGLLDCGLVNVQSCNTGGHHEINILSDGPGASGLGGGLGLLDPQVGVVAAVIASL